MPDGAQPGPSSRYDISQDPIVTDDGPPLARPTGLALDRSNTSSNVSAVLVHKRDCKRGDDTPGSPAGSGSCDCGRDLVESIPPETLQSIPHYKITVPEFFSLSGMGRYQYIHALCFIFIFIRDGIEVIYAALIKPSLSCLWDLDEFEGFMIPAFPALTYAIGSQVFGVLADKYGRKVCLITALGTALAFDIGCSFSGTFLVFIILRCCAGFSLGGAFAITLTYWAEIVPKNVRFKSLFIFSLFWSVGTVLAVVDGWSMADMMDRLNYHVFILIICIPNAIAFLLSFTLYETPSYYIVSGQIDKAVKRIKDVIEMNKMETASYDVLCEGHFYDRGAIEKLFKLPYLKVTVTFMALSFGVGYTFSGWTNLISNLFVSNYCTYYQLFIEKKYGVTHGYHSELSDSTMYTVATTEAGSSFCLALSSQAYILILIAVLGAFPGSIVAYVMSKKSGPMNYVIVTFFLAAYFFYAMNFCILPHPYAFYLFYSELFLTRALLGGGYLTLWLYTPVYYHTQVRAVGVGLGICMQKIGTASAAAVVVFTSISFKIYSFALLCIFVSAIAILLSEPVIRKFLFNQTGNVMKPPSLADLYKHHHIPAADLSWHIKNVEKEEKRKRRELPPYVFHRQNNNALSTPGGRGPDFNWVDFTPSPDTANSDLTSQKYFSSPSLGGGSSVDRDIPLEAFNGRNLYRDSPTPGKPTFYFDRSRYPKRGVRPVSAEPGNTAVDDPTETTYILTPTHVRSEGNTPDPAAAERKRVFVRKRPGLIYENSRRIRRRERSQGGRRDEDGRPEGGEGSGHTGFEIMHHGPNGGRTLVLHCKSTVDSISKFRFR
eukprot:sb/3462089/